jgi:hypothetical protein
MEISGNWIAVYFGRVMFQNQTDSLHHQASYGFILNKNNLERMQNYTIPYASHSFDQFILPIENGFIFVDRGDANPRGFQFIRVQNGQSNKRVAPFVFKPARESQPQDTFSQIAGFAKTSSGYIFAGTYEKTGGGTRTLNASRNIFILTLDNELNSTREPVWITDYTKTNYESVANPRFTALSNGRYLLMWELAETREINGSYMTIIDERGNRLAPIEWLGNRVRVNDKAVLQYNRTNGKVYWSVGGFYKLDIDDKIKNKKILNVALKILEYKKSL